ncbi:MAG: thiamine pyrophosphate-dependent enzyme [Chloroflexota bacterium]
MKRTDCAALIAAHLAPDDIIICSLGSAGRAWRAQQAANPTYYGSDPMGMGPSLALGMALAQPRRRVTLIEGDGDLSMNLGVLLTIAGAAPANLRIVVFQNGRYETGGGQALPAGEMLSFGTIATGAGFHYGADAADAEQANQRMTELFTASGPGLIAVQVEPEASSYPAPPRWSQVEERSFFMKQLHGE